MLTNPKEKIIFQTIGEIQKSRTERTRTTTVLAQIFGYSLTAEDDASAWKFMQKLCRDDHEAALAAYMHSHSLKQVRRACEFVRTMIYNLDD